MNQIVTSTSVQTPTIRQQAPEAVLVQLREIDFTADLFRWEGRHWFLGWWGVNNLKREERLGKSLDRVRTKYPIGPDRDRLIAFYEMCLNGFRVIDKYEIDGSEHDFGMIVEDFRQADFTDRHNRERAFEALVDDQCDLDIRNRRIAERTRDRIRGEASLAHKYIIRKAKNFIMPGVPR